MSLPNEVDFVLIKIGDGGGPETFTLICGLTDATINEQAQSSDRYVRDCTKPGEVPFRKTKVGGKSLDVTGSGMSNADQYPTLRDALGKVGNYQLELRSDDGTDAGNLLGTVSGAFRLTANNLNVPREGAASAQINLASHGEWDYTAA